LADVEQFGVFSHLNPYDQPKKHKGWTVRTLIQFRFTVPVKIRSNAYNTSAQLFTPKASRRWWRLFLQYHYPKRTLRRPSKETKLDL
jgi:hypothetical protein